MLASSGGLAVQESLTPMGICGIALIVNLEISTITVVTIPTTRCGDTLHRHTVMCLIASCGNVHYELAYGTILPRYFGGIEISGVLNFSSGILFEHLQCYYNIDLLPASKILVTNQDAGGQGG